LPIEAQEVLWQYKSKDNTPPAPRGPTKFMAKSHDYHLLMTLLGIDLEDQDLQSADLTHADPPNDQEIGSATPDPISNDDAQPLLAF